MEYHGSTWVMLGFALLGLIYVCGLYYASSLIIADLKQRKAEFADIHKELMAVKDQASELHLATVRMQHEQRKENEKIKRHNTALEAALGQIEIIAKQQLGKESNIAKVNEALRSILSLASRH